MGLTFNDRFSGSVEYGENTYSYKKEKQDKPKKVKRLKSKGGIKKIGLKLNI